MTKRTLIATFAIAILALGGGLALWLQMETGEDIDSSTESSQSETSTNDRNQELDEEKRQRSQDGDNDNDSDQNQDNQDDTSEDSQDEPSGNYEASIVLNNFGQQENGTVYANATVDDATEGTCEFRFRRNGASVTKTAQVEMAPTGYYACGIRTEASQFSPKGEWTARAYLQNTDPQVRSEQRSTRIQ